MGKERVRCNLAIAKQLDDVLVRSIEGEESMAERSSIVNIIEGSEKKTLFFTSFVEVVKGLGDILKEKGFQPLQVYGETNKDLQSMVSGFEKKEALNPMIATYQSLSSAVPLVMANTVVMLNSPFRHHEYMQAMSRVHRRGQDSQVYVYDVYLDTKGVENISTRSEDILNWSKLQVEQIMGVKSSDLSYSLEDYCELCDIQMPEIIPSLESHKHPHYLEWK